MRRLLAGVWRDESGIILPYVTVMLVVFIGFASLALDAARYVSLQTQLQKAADAAAIAGAAELDRFSTSTTRANTAVLTMLSNNTLFGPSGDVPVTIQSVRFLSALPASDTTVATTALCTGNGCTAAQSIQARFVEVVVNPVTMNAIMPLPFLNAALPQGLTVGASAVAGQDSVNCGLTPMFICNPFEQPGDTYAQATQRIEAADADPAFKRRLIRLSDSGVSGTFGPGDFGYLVPEPGSLPSDSCFPGGQEIGRAMAMARPLVCVRQNGVDLLTGNTTSALNGLNTRFGKYGASFSEACKAAYPPDLNTRTGWVPHASGDWCRGSPDGSPTGAGVDWPGWTAGSTNKPLPADACLLTGNNCSPIANVGEPTWDCLTYWNSAHSSAGAPGGCTATATISRYEVYQYEIDNGLLSDSGSNLSNPETGAPQCTGPTPSAERRFMDVALVNCQSSPVTVQSNATNVPVAAFARFFLTVAVPTSGQVKPYAEFRGILERGQGTIYDQVQLYR